MARHLPGSARVVAGLRTGLARRYRASLQQDSRDLPLFLAAAAAVDGVAGARRRWRERSTEDLRAWLTQLVSRTGGSDAVLVRRLTVTRSGHLALDVTGPVGRPGRQLVLVTDDARQELDTVAVPSADGVRLACLLPAIASDALVVLSDGTVDVPVVVAPRAALAPRGRTGPGRQLLLTPADGPAATTVAVELGLTAVDVRWSGPRTLRLTTADAPDVTVAPSAPGRARITLADLVGDGARTWSVQLGDGAHWEPVRAPHGVPVSAIGETVVGSAGRTAHVRVHYDRRGTLLIDTGARR